MYGSATRWEENIGSTSWSTLYGGIPRNVCDLGSSATTRTTPVTPASGNPVFGAATLKFGQTGCCGPECRGSSGACNAAPAEPFPVLDMPARLPPFQEGSMRSFWL